jgi:hypothetical protein
VARIKRFHELRGRAVRLHPTEVDCGYAVFEQGGTRYLVLETYGSDGRELPGKVSQSIQLDAAGVAELRQILDRAFPQT